jgi:hypothetical protein
MSTQHELKLFAGQSATGAGCYRGYRRKFVANAVLDAIYEAVKRLTPDEQQQLKAWLEVQTENAPSAFQETELDRRLLEAGLMRAVPILPDDLTALQAWTPAQISDRPLSEVIIEERG